ncbi:hypothetical protein Acr_22g0001970 [Actinidia rufa]|uniref:DUF7913 domain-containing protein n=1 Tax=Actinidia rufa TaxID=165716 RepID=A0A7J0GJ17_9ERIC|nr:hypothetical protein Acr_22g0001970 [Actinidia rufa]
MESSSSTSEVGAAEDVIQALLDYLVDPLLPLKSSGREVPSLAQQQSVAKQVPFDFCFLTPYSIFFWVLAI